MTPKRAALIARLGERRIAERRAAGGYGEPRIRALADEINRLRAIVEAQNELLNQADHASKGGDADALAVVPDRDSWGGSGRRGAVLTGAGRSLMDDPLNPERDPAPFAAVRP